MPPGRCSVDLALLWKLVERQCFLSDPELTHQLPPHPLARYRLAPLPCANRRRLDPQQEPELCLAQVPGLAVLAELVHGENQPITSGCKLTSRRGTCYTSGHNETPALLVTAGGTASTCLWRH